MLVEPELLKLCVRKDRKAQFQLYRNCFDVLMGVCMRYERNREDATELLNMGFLKILTNLDKYKSDAPFEPWIKRIMINTIIDEYRKKNKSRAASIEYHALEEDGYFNKHVDYNEADQQFDAEELENMMKLLPPISRQVFNLHVIDGYNHKEIGAMLSISDGTSKWHVSFARKKLKEMLNKSLNKLHTAES